MYKIVFLGLLFLTQTIEGQNKTLFLLVENPSLKFCCEKSLCFGFAINSKDENFTTDYYKFDVGNVKGFSYEEKYDYEYFTVEELRKKVDIDTLKYKTIQSLSKDKQWWQIHNELSLKDEIFLLEKRKGKFNSKLGKYDYNYYILPLIYEGTRKNIVPTDLSFIKK